ncbi:uncharacterized protein B0H64DRAFT_426156 [Chaetomium fimeti]|uniref:Protein kinase domain-containing protein n=1 Tax=Chaetomium fimeti TaxID=1854472 RepID=A0AAE0HBY1_9PEZI|nr:hypothetical protein B0H64DRAFT_426156 [Chaetomium fimeti]
MDQQNISEVLAKLRQPPVFTPAPPRPRRPPGRLRLDRDPHAPVHSSQTIRFRFWTRFIQATATPPSVVQTLLGLFVRRLPSFIQTWFESWFPEWNLPFQLSLKRQKEGWYEEFEMEKAAYVTLQPLQGVFVPRCFGQLRCDNTRALLLSDIGGECLATPAGSLLETPELRRLLSETLTALGQFRILQDDVKLDNFHIVGDRIMAVDFERLQNQDMPEDKIAIDVKATTYWLARLYEWNQYSFWEDGFIKVDR